ncbi:MAG: DUF4846 domain-containing protein [Candidatus Wallbacteria bacterium]|nr:DUF4846 domain-containing protein [Candidatus Wallbacteria bacterium]
MRYFYLIPLFFYLTSSWSAERQKPVYFWNSNYDSQESIAIRILPPEEFERVQVKAGSFEEWLRWLPLKKGFPPVKRFDGKLNRYKFIHFAVLDLDFGDRRSHGAAQSLEYLYAEYLFSQEYFWAVHFKLNTGKRVDLRQWQEGERPFFFLKKLNWEPKAPESRTYENFRDFMEFVFSNTNADSLVQELIPVTPKTDLEIGDIFIIAGTGGQAVIVLDKAVNKKTGQQVFLLGQGSEPAQEFHLLQNTTDSYLNPWYHADFGDHLITPKCVFMPEDRKRFLKEY